MPMATPHCLRLRLEGTLTPSSETTSRSPNTPYQYYCNVRIYSVLYSFSFLLSLEANPNKKGQYGRTPLYRAAFAGHAEAVKVCLIVCISHFSMLKTLPLLFITSLYLDSSQEWSRPKNHSWWRGETWSGSPEFPIHLIVYHDHQTESGKLWKKSRWLPFLIIGVF